MVLTKKDIGINWIGEIPNNWSYCRFKDVVNLYTGNSIKDQDKDNYCDNIEARPYISSKDINVLFNDINYDTGLFIKKDDEDFKIAPKFSILMCIEGGSAGRKKAITFEEVSFVNKLCCFVPKNNDLDFGYLYYFLCSPNYEDYFFSQMTGMIGGVSISKLNNFNILLPPIEEQRRISNFLSNKVKIIDDIIKETLILIEYYNEYKKSLITEVVTKGLNENIKMKDSTIEWIGEIPEHWEITKIRFIGSLQNGISKTSEYFGHGYPFVSYGDVYNNDELPGKICGKLDSTIHERNTYSVKKNDIFFTRTSETIDEIGISSICTKTIENATFAGFLIRLRLFENVGINVNFLKYYLQSITIRDYFAKMMVIVTRASLGQNLLKNLNILLPPIYEQEEIVNYLDKKCKPIDSIITEKEKLIDKLEEYKKSLIFEYVTGKKEVPK